MDNETEELHHSEDRVNVDWNNQIDRRLI